MTTQPPAIVIGAPIAPHSLPGCGRLVNRSRALPRRSSEALTPLTAGEGQLLPAICDDGALR